MIVVVVFVVTAVPTATAAAAATAAVATTTAATVVVATATAAAAAVAAVVTMAMDGGLLPDLCMCVAVQVRRSPYAHKEAKAYWGLPERSFQDELTYCNQLG